MTIPAIPAIQHLTMQNAPQYLGNLARTNHFQVYIEDGWGKDKGGDAPFLKHLQNSTGNPSPSLASIYEITWNTEFQRKLAFSCFDATLPASTYATGEVKDNFMGVPQEFAHTRINTDIDFSFYVDRDYKILMFFEAWMNYISGGNSDELNEPSLYTSNVGSYYRRYNYPKFYKNESGFYIKKFEKDYIVPGAKSITYNLINAFPKSMTSIPLAYGEAEIMKVTVTMNYDRYRIYRETATEQTASTPLQIFNADGTSNTYPIEQYSSNSTGSQSTLAQLADQGAFGPQTLP
jgi:hypothetical protein